VRRLLPAYLDELAALEDRLAAIDSRLDAAKPAEDEGDAEGDEGAQDEDAGLSEDEIKQLKVEQRQLRKEIKTQGAQLLARLDTARAGLTQADCRRLVLDLLRDDLAAQLKRAVAAHRRAVVAALENWWDKYRVTLRDIERERDAAAERLDSYLRELEYVR
jgi:type I restriction enzyme M protein